MKIKILIALLLLSATITFGNLLPQNFNKSAYYKAISSENINELNDQLALLNGSALPEKEAYEGALLMKKAGMGGNPKEKLELFKSGKIKLETCIKKDSLNSEFRFLRLIIQENAPKIMKYSSEIKKDSEFIQRSFKSLPVVVREAISDYSKRSKTLKIKEN